MGSLFAREFPQDRRRLRVLRKCLFSLSLIPGIVSLFGCLKTSDCRIGSDMQVEPAVESPLQVLGERRQVPSKFRESLLPAGRVPLLSFGKPQENCFSLGVLFGNGELAVELRAFLLCPPVLLESSYDFDVRYWRMIVHRRSPSAGWVKDTLM